MVNASSLIAQKYKVRKYKHQLINQPKTSSTITLSALNLLRIPNPLYGILHSKVMALKIAPFTAF